MTAREGEVLDPSEMVEDDFLTKKLVNVNGIMIWSYLGVEPDHRFDRDHEKEEEEEWT